LLPAFFSSEAAKIQHYIVLQKATPKKAEKTSQSTVFLTERGLKILITHCLEIVGKFEDQNQLIHWFSNGVKKYLFQKTGFLKSDKQGFLHQGDTLQICDGFWSKNFVRSTIYGLGLGWENFP